MSEYDQISASFQRCDESGAFSDTFYEIFMSKSEDVKHFFTDTDFTKQKKLLRATVKVLATKNVAMTNSDILGMNDIFVLIYLCIDNYYISRSC